MEKVLRLSMMASTISCVDERTRPTRVVDVVVVFQSVSQDL